MIPTRSLVHDIHQVVGAEGAVDRQRLAQLVWEYAATCRLVNDRARMCLDLLRQGMRGEAVRLAQEAPDLQAEILLLDFEERPAWIALCDQAGLPVSEAFDAQALYGVAQELYGEAGALDHLLGMHRRMAVGGAPLADRLRVLRRIQRADPRSEFWLDDVRAYEAALQEELFQQAEKADVAGDVAALDAILAQLRSPEWRVPPPPAMARAVEKVALPHRRRRAQAALAALADQFRNAREHDDETLCRRLLAEWKEVAASTGVEPDAAAAERVAAVGAWLDERARAAQADAAFRQSCQALEGALGDGAADKATLDRLADAVLRSGRGLPPMLAARLGSRTEEIERRGRRRFILILASIVGAVVLAGAAMVAVGLRVEKQRRLQRTVDQAQQAVAAGDLDGAARVLDAAGADVAGDPEIARLQADVRRRRTQADAARRRLDEDLALVEAMIAGIEKDAAEPVPADGTGRLEALAARVPALLARLAAARARIDTLAADAPADAKARLGPLRVRAGTLEGTLRQGLAGALTRRVQALEREYAALGPACRGHVQVLTDLKEGRRPASEKEAARAEAGTLLDRAARLKADTASVSAGPETPETVRTAVAALAARLDADAKALGAAMTGLFGTEAALDQIRRSYEDPDTLRSRLEDFAARYPSHVLAEDFAQAAAMAPHWRAAVAWQTIVGGWGRNPRVADAAEATRRGERIEKYLADFPESPHKAAAETYLEYLTVARGALAGRQLKSLKATADLLAGGLILHLDVVRTGDGRRFYLADAARDFRKQQSGGAVTGYALSYIADGSLARRSVLLAPSADVSDPVTAPQSALAEKMVPLVLRSEGAGWETFYLGLIQMLFDQPDLDPLLAATILKLDFLPAAADSTPFVGTQIRRKIDALADLGDLNESHWMDPDDADANLLRPRAAQVLRNLGSPAPLAAAVQNGLDTLGRSLAAYRPVGVLLPDADGPLRPAAGTEGDVYVLWSTAGLAPRFEKIGAVAAGKFTPAGLGPSRYPMGTPVFAPRP